MEGVGRRERGGEERGGEVRRMLRRREVGKPSSQQPRIKTKRNYTTEGSRKWYIDRGCWTYRPTVLTLSGLCRGRSKMGQREGEDVEKLKVGNEKLS